MIIAIDFETYYSKKDYSLSKATTEAYIRDPRFEVIGISVKIDDEPAQWFSGSKEETQGWLNQFPWGTSFILAHNMHFDGAILAWRFGIIPKGYFDTLSMANALHGINKSCSLKALAEQYGLQEKGTEVDDADGKRRKDFTPEQLEAFKRRLAGYEGYSLPYRNIKADGTLGFGSMKVTKKGCDLRLVLIFDHGKLIRSTVEGTQSLKQVEDENLWPSIIRRGIGFAF